MTPVLLAVFVFVGLLAAQWLGTQWLAGQPARPSGPPAASVFASTASPSRFTGALGRLAAPSDPAEARVVGEDLVQAGFRGPHAFSLYLAARTALALLLPALGWLVVRTQRTNPAVVALLALATLGYYLPFLVVRGLRDERRARVRRVFPDALDMLVSCLESGLGIDAALRYVAKDLQAVAPDLAAELDSLNAELQAGLSRPDAMRRMNGRIGVEEVESLVNVLAQAERYGTGIAESIRAHAQMSRRRRILDAERRAAEAAPKLTVAMILFVLPPLFIVLIGPTVIHVATEVIPMLEHR